MPSGILGHRRNVVMVEGPHDSPGERHALLRLKAEFHDGGERFPPGGIAEGRAWPSVSAAARCSFLMTRHPSACGAALR